MTIYTEEKREQNRSAYEVFRMLTAQETVLITTPAPNSSIADRCERERYAEVARKQAERDERATAMLIESVTRPNHYAERREQQRQADYERTERREEDRAYRTNAGFFQGFR